MTSKIWSEKNFNELSWHDCKIHAVSFNNADYELCFDIDFILKWVDPKVNDDYYTFDIAPAILLFRNVYDLSINLQGLDVEIQEIQMLNPAIPKNRNHILDSFEFDWNIDTNCGEINFKSTGFMQYLKTNPVVSQKQYFNLTERGGISFKIP